jgi:hypothetical protein
MVMATNPAFLAAFGEEVVFSYDGETITVTGIVNIVDRVPYLIDGQDQTVLNSIDCDPPDVSWLTDDLIPYWQVTAQGIAYNIAGVERNEMTTIRLKTVRPEDY